MTKRPIQRLLVSAGIIATVFAGSAGVAAAEESDPTGDPLGGARTPVCDTVVLLRPTSTCSVYDPATETSTNPYTADGNSPGIFGLGLLGLL